jgi:cell wall-associated NlpC family hydrolase
LLSGCGGKGEPATDAAASRPKNCPERAQAAADLPRTKPELKALSYWLGLLTPSQLDEPLLDADALAAQDLALRNGADGQPRPVDLSRPLSSEQIAHELKERLVGLAARFEAGDFRVEGKNALELFRAGAKSSFREAVALHVALEPITLHCAPLLDVLRATRADARFDRNQCSQVRAQEPVELLGRIGELWYARSRYAMGFIAADAPLSPRVPAQLAPIYQKGRELQLLRALELAGQRLPAGSMLASEDGRTALVASEQDITHTRALSAGEARSARRTITRRDFLSEAFRYMDSPYGLGDEDGGRDCSRFILDVLRSFGIHLPRSSVEQSRAGTYVIEVPPEASQTERLALLDEAVKRGIVLYHFPGHIAIYLGRDKEGTPRLLHSFAEYLAPCAGGGETLFEVGRIGVSDLLLGKDTSRKSFLERLTRLTIFGKPPGYALLALSRFRPAAAPALPAPANCKDSAELALFHTPREPHADAPLRVIAVSREDTRPAGVWLVDPDGQLLAPELHELGVGPFARFAQLEHPKVGAWTALIADGPRVLACERFQVGKSPGKPTPGDAPGMRPAWQVRRSWGPSSENFYAAFVEQLFAHPIEDLRSWSSLSELLNDPVRNLLFDYLGKHEETRFKLAPDCADLPYFLRAYFAWKLGLPFGFRRCSRGRAGVPPHCDELITNQMEVSAADEVSAFHTFVRKQLANGVHSASGRTLPDDEASDLYPLPLTREALKPGSVFIDPYGHMIVVAQWVAQGLAGQGMLLGADAQPDATVGRRRFWRGNFLFTPDTRDVGAGFKAFRPVLRDAQAGGLAEATDKLLTDSRDFAAPSLEQYQGQSPDLFYDRMDELIYPRPVSVGDRMQRVVDALEEQVKRRVEAIDVGEAFMREQKQPIAMPDGYAVFETQGPWEDFATPSRDMRLLLAVDAVQGFPAQVRARPERFMATAAEVEGVERALAQLLSTRTVRYTRSDGSAMDLSLAEVLRRAPLLETGYNPNDCIEARWGAAPDSDEYRPCARRAPAPQKQAMERYREWFHTRTRPARP